MSFVANSSGFTQGCMGRWGGKMGTAFPHLFFSTAFPHFFEKVWEENYCQKVFNRGALRFCGGSLPLCVGGDIIKLTKTPLIYSVSRSKLGGLELCLGS